MNIVSVAVDYPGSCSKSKFGLVVVKFVEKIPSRGAPATIKEQVLGDRKWE